MSVNEIKIWMLKNEVKHGDIAKGYGCNPSFASDFINGKKTSKGLVDYMTGKGCPIEYFKNGRVAA